MKEQYQNSPKDCSLQSSDPLATIALLSPLLDMATQTPDYPMLFLP